MASDTKTPVVLCWHMHQPSYQDMRTDQFLFPWVYLHTIKDYSDMAAHLEANQEARAVVNFAPVLLEQIETYLIQILATLCWPHWWRKSCQKPAHRLFWV
jgi:alpha-amylase/alpha-mannosidase (GH57 family)